MKKIVRTKLSVKDQLKADRALESAVTDVKEFISRIQSLTLRLYPEIKTRLGRCVLVLYVYEMYVRFLPIVAVYLSYDILLSHPHQRILCLYIHVLAIHHTHIHTLTDMQGCVQGMHSGSSVSSHPGLIISFIQTSSFNSRLRV